MLISSRHKVPQAIYIYLPYIHFVTGYEKHEDQERKVVIRLVFCHFQTLHKTICSDNLVQVP